MSMAAPFCVLRSRDVHEFLFEVYGISFYIIKGVAHTIGLDGELAHKEK